MSAMIRHMPARVGTTGRSAHRQWLSAKRQPGQRGTSDPPRARNGLELRAKRAVRRRATAWGAAKTLSPPIHMLQRKQRHLGLAAQPQATAQFP